MHVRITEISKETKTDILDIVFLSSSPVLDLGSDITTVEDLTQLLVTQYKETRTKFHPLKNVALYSDTFL